MIDTRVDSKYNENYGVLCPYSGGYLFVNEDYRMRISYNKLWKLLIDKKMSKADLRKAAKISPNTMTKMRRDEEVSMSVLLKIANYLKCDISDMVEFVDTEE